MICFSRRPKSNVGTKRVQCERLEPRQLLTIAATATLPDVSVGSQQGAFPINLSQYFADATPGSNLAFFSTNLGVIPVQLSPGTTPLTVANFKSYINEGDYTGTIISESQPGSFFLGGVYNVTNGQINAVTEKAPVANEFGASNVRGTIAMAQKSAADGTATDAFLFNESDNNAASFDAAKLTVFGSIVGDYGLSVMDAIANVPVPNPPPIATLDTLPVLDYTPGATVTAAQLVQIRSVTFGSEGFSVQSDDSSVVVASVTGDNLTFTPFAQGTAHLTVTAVGSDGVPVTQTFAVTVGVAKPATPIAPSSANTLPSTVVVGAAIKGHEVVRLTTSADVNSITTVSLLLAPTTGQGADFLLASAHKRVKVKSGGKFSITLPFKHIPDDLPPGKYQIAVSVANADSATALSTLNATVTIVPKQVDLGGLFKKLPARVKAGRKVNAVIFITNSGNTEASGLLTLNVTKSTDNSVLETPMKLVHIKPGKSMAIHLSWIAGASGEQYSLDVQIDPNGAFEDTNLGNNLVASPTTVSVT